MNLLFKFICVVFSLTLLACSNFYDGFKAVEIDNCYRLPYPDQEECLRQIDIGYEEYKQQREEAKRRD